MKTKNNRIQQAITSLTFKNPFFASIALQADYIEDMKCKTFWTDGKNIGYNPNFVDSLTHEEIMGVLAHETMHIVLLHAQRLGDRELETYNKAADYLINYQLVEAGFKLPKGVLLDNRFQENNAEDVYRILMLEKDKKDKEKKNNNQNQSEEGKNKSEPDCGFGEVRAGNSEEAKENEERAIIMGKMAEMAAKQCGNMPAGIERMLAESRKTITDWREVLNRFLNEVTAKDYCFSRPNKRFLDRGFVLPSLYSKTIGKVIVAVDTSGSVDTSELNRLITEVTKILDYINESSDTAEIDIIYFDHKVQGHETYTGSEVLKPKGGGGTCFRTFINYINEQELNPDLVICLTDGMSFSFPAAPEYPVLWALTTSSYSPNVPFGEKMILQ